MRFRSWPNWLTSRWAVLVLILILLSVGGLEMNQWRKRRQVQKEIDTVVRQQQDLEQKNRDLAASLGLLNTQEYREKIAREQLNLKKDGEIVVNFSQAQGQQGQPVAVTESNPHKWWRYFFEQ